LRENHRCCGDAATVASQCAGWRGWLSRWRRDHLAWVVSAGAFGEKHHAAIHSRWKGYQRKYVFSPLVTPVCDESSSVSRTDWFPACNHATVSERPGLEPDTLTRAVSVQQVEFALHRAVPQVVVEHLDHLF